MICGNSIINYIVDNKGIYISNNIFLTIAVGILILNLLYKVLESKKLFSILRIISAIMLIICGIFLEGGIVLIPFMLITYFAKGNLKIRNILYLVLSVLLLFVSYVPYDTIELTINMLMYNSDFLFITVIPFLYLYNGERGIKNNFTKYFFYVFYPAHIWIIAIITYIIK